MALVIFDLDGTLVDSIEGIGASMNMVLDMLTYPRHSMEAYKSFVGHGIKHLVRMALPPEAASDNDILEDAYEKMLQVYQLHYGDGLVVYDGIKKLLDKLVEKGHRLAVLTNKHQSMADPIVSGWFTDYPFETVVGRHESRPKKPDPTAVHMIMEKAAVGAEETIYVGDSEVDLMTARNAGVQEVIVTWGFRDRSALELLKPENLIDEPMELIDLMEGA